MTSERARRRHPRYRTSARQCEPEHSIRGITHLLPAAVRSHSHPLQCHGPSRPSFLTRYVRIPILLD